ncbi:hypothetical protein HY642_06440 [Candidatus Woesearchaeota archaeon]|nr:hypothetical protein [Candidatus Woesearchaeota archaeon]
MNAELALDAAYGLVTSRFFVDARKPKVVVGDQHMLAYCSIQSVRDLARLPDIVYDDATDAVILGDGTFSQTMMGDRRAVSPSSMFLLCVTLGHAVQCQLNPGLRRGAIFELLKGDQQQQEHGAALEAFNAGMANYIAIEAMQRGKDKALVEEALAMDEYLTEEHHKWTVSETATELLAPRYKCASCDWPRIMLGYMREGPWRMEVHRNDLGYWHVTTLRPKNIAQAIKTPPDTLEKLLFL